VIEGTTSIVVVDDMRVNIEILKKRLSSEKYNIISFTSSDECAKKLDELSCEVFILDIEMPELNGLELGEKIKSHPKHGETPILYFTGSDSADVLERAFQVGAIDFLPKQISELELKLRLRNVIQLNRAKEKIIKQSEMMEIYLRLMFHDMASPLTVCQFNLEKARAISQHSDQIKRLDKSIYSLGRVLDLTSDIKAFFQGSVPEKIGNAHELLFDVTTLFQDRLSDKSIDLEVVNQLPESRKINIPRSFMVHQIISNFLSNAIKFSPTHGKITLTIRPLQGEGNQPKAEIIIRDYGQGMSPDALADFARRKPSRTTLGTSGEKGTGSGVMIANFFLDKFAGRLVIESSTEGTSTNPKGTSVHLMVPLV
jgi:two-component system, sensor histidine kinase and response regulator